MSKTHWKKLINPDYLGAYSLDEGKDLTVTIEKVGVEEVTGNGGKKENCTVARLKGQKPFILNRTNQKTIQKVLGSPYIEDWAGKSITVFVSETKLKGEMVECLRVRPVLPKPAAKSKLTDERFTEALEAVKAGSYKKETLLSKFDLTPEQIKQLG